MFKKLSDLHITGIVKPTFFYILSFFVFFHLSLPLFPHANPFSKQAQTVKKNVSEDKDQDEHTLKGNMSATKVRI